MEDDENVTVEFERRPELHVAHTLDDEMTIRYALDYAPRDQKGGGSSATRAGTFDCYSTGPPCELTARYDAGTVITIDAGVGSNVANFRGWGGACASAGTNPVCELTLTDDSAVTATWSY
jgi:hypothetical protein